MTYLALCLKCDVNPSLSRVTSKVSPLDVLSRILCLIFRIVRSSPELIPPVEHSHSVDKREHSSKCFSLLCPNVFMILQMPNLSLYIQTFFRCLAEREDETRKVLGS